MSTKMTFEQADAKLAAAVEKMEKGDLTLKESVEQYTEACKLLMFCMQELEACKGQIEDINEKLKNEGGQWIED